MVSRSYCNRGLNDSEAGCEGREYGVIIYSSRRECEYSRTNNQDRHKYRELSSVGRALIEKGVLVKTLTAILLILWEPDVTGSSPVVPF